MNDKGNKGEGNSTQTILVIIIAAVVTFFVYTMVKGFFVTGDATPISYTAFNSIVEDPVQKNKIEKIEWGSNEIFVELKENASLDGIKTLKPAGKHSSSYGKMLSPGNNRLVVVPVDADAPRLVEKMLNEGIEICKKKPDQSGAIMETIVGIFLPFIILFVIMNMTMRRMGGGSGIMGVGKSTAKMYMQKETGVNFQDVAGADEAKESLVEIVDFLHNPEKYTKIGAKLPKGALLVGPPGTGKTLLAKAVAGEAKVPFYSLTGSDFVEMFVGVGASRVRDLFKQASQSAPCIIFIDEIDAIGKSRDSRYGGGNDEREQTLNQLLSEMDGFDASKGIMVMGATNRPEILDPALLRPGRFDRRVIVEKPDLKGRVSILKVHARNVSLDNSVDFEEIALATSGAVGADLANMINEAAITAVKHRRLNVTQADLFEAVEVVLVGKEKKDRVLSQQERRIVSYHEVGHALVAAIQKNSEPVQKITIVPRTKGALGYVMQVPEEEKYLNTEAELKAMLVGYLAGRAAEEIVFDTVTTGAANDIERATALARAMVTQYGMSERFGLMGLETQRDKYLGGSTTMNCGDDTAAAVDEVVMIMLKKAYDEAKKILRENRYALDEIAAFLIERETITGKEFMEILNKVRSEHGDTLICDKTEIEKEEIKLQSKATKEDSILKKQDENIKEISVLDKKDEVIHNNINSEDKETDTMESKDDVLKDNEVKDEEVIDKEANDNDSKDEKKNSENISFEEASRKYAALPYENDAKKDPDADKKDI